jgi:acyl-CoA synthetase (AMP-forming)/AMP-acid ligase II
MNLVDLIGSDPDRTAVVLPEQQLRVSYRSLRNQVEAAAAALGAAGVQRTDRVGLALPNGLPAIVCTLAAAIAGTAAPLNHAYREDEFRFYFEDAGIRTLILPAGGCAEAQRAAGSRIRILAADLDASGRVSLAGANGRRGVDIPASDAVALLLHTSGSTGTPKRVPLTHAHLTTSAGNVARTYALGPEDVTLCVMPLFHVHGLVASLLATLATGGTIVVPSSFNALSFWRTAREHDITWYSAVPTIHQLLLRRAAGASSRSTTAPRLRFIRSCSAALSPATMHTLEAAFGAPLLEAYGMTEAAHQIASNPLPPAPRKPGTVGRGTHVHIGVVDEQGRHLPPGQQGEIVVRGPNVIRAYENDPAATARSFIGEWFKTGDEGYVDADGYLTLVGRRSEQINRGGEKIAPREIDELLLEHATVAEAVCFAVPHEIWGQEVHAAVVAGGASEAELLAFCRERLSEYKCPKRIYIVDAIPRTATGKIQRRLVAQALAGGA